MLSSSEVINIWNGLFLEADLTFIFTSDCEIHSDSDHFRVVAGTNRYTPLRNIVLCRTLSNIRYPSGFEYLKRNEHRGMDRSARHKVMFFPLDVTLGYNNALNSQKCELFMNIA